MRAVKLGEIRSNLVIHSVVSRPVFCYINSGGVGLAKRGASTQSIVGSPFYTAPEILAQELFGPYNLKVDVFR